MDYQGGGNRQGGRGRGRGGRSAAAPGRGDAAWHSAPGPAYDGAHRGGGRGSDAPAPYRGEHSGGGGSGAPAPYRTEHGGGRGSGAPAPYRGEHSGGGGSGATAPYRGEHGGGRGPGTPAPYRGEHGGGRGPPGARGGGRSGAYEGGRGGGRGPGAPRGQPSSGSSAGQMALQLAKLNISSTPEIVDGKRVPMRCPDNGGTLGITSLNLLSNHFLLNFDRTFCVFHYEIDIKFENNSESSEAPEVSKSELATIKQQLFRNCASSLPDDGARNIFSPVTLQEGQFRVKVHDTAYRVSVVLQKRFSMGDLANAPFPREILQGLDVIARMNSARQCIQVGRNFFMRNQSRDIGMGASALEGYKQSIKETENGLILCVDYSVMAFQNPVPVIEFLNQLGFSLKEQTQLSGRERIEAERAVKRMRVTITHRRSSQKFQVQGLTAKNTSEITFFDESLNRERSLLDYYKETYDITIKYRKLPCLSLSKTKTNYVPMELCKVIEGQLVPKDKISRDGNNILRDMALISPKRRMDAILNMVQSQDGPCRGKILDEFHLTVNKNMVNVTARLLERPTLKLLNASGSAYKFNIPNNDCQWNLVNDKVLLGKRIDSWAILDLSQRQQRRRSDRWFDAHDFAEHFVQRCRRMGMPIKDEPLFVESVYFDSLSDPDCLRQVLQSCKSKAGGSLQLLLCPMLERHEGYKILKLVCETELGIVTQCCIPSKIRNMDQYLANLALKVNAKLGGSNFELFDSLPAVDTRYPILFIGADVNHPSSRITTIPSIVAVVASLNWPASNNYSSIVQAQKHRKEDIVDIGRMCRQLFDRFVEANRCRPRQIIYFRDGVSESQFDMVLNVELTEIKTAIESANYKPMMTVVVAQKRHQTRLFPKDNNGPLSTRSGNVPPGTVVDKGITSSMSFNFFLCSHNGLLGTSKPTHYHVLWDEFGYTSDGIQQLIYNLCFTFARCTKPVSLVPPVYYADLLAYRGRIYYEGMMGISSSAPDSQSVSSSSTLVEPIRLPELNVAVKNGMFFL